MTTQTEALKLALEALEDWNSPLDPQPDADIITAIKEALSSPNGEAQPEQPSARTGNCLLTGVCASEGHKIQKSQPEQKPVSGWTGNTDADAALVMLDRLDVSSDDDERVDEISNIVRRLTTPPQQSTLVRKPLTDEEMDAVIDGCPKYHGRFSTKDPDGKLNYYELIRAIEAAHGIKE